MAMPHGVLQSDPDRTGTLLVVFLRGGADGLNMVVPVEDDAYHAARPQIGVGKKVAVPLDGFFALHPDLAPLRRLYDDGTMLVVHQAGSEDETRSHFEAQDLMEHGGLAAGGWLGRYLRERSGGEAGPLAAVALGKTQPECLRGAPASVTMDSLDTFTFGASAAGVVAGLSALYEAESDDLGAAGRDTLRALARIERLRGTPYRPATGARYEPDEFAQALMQAARLIKARVGVEALCVDLDGWDSHFAQGPLITPLMQRLARGLDAFCADLGPLMADTSIVVMSEFGRRVRENASFGTDHGRGGVMFLLGGGTTGGRVLSRWQGLDRDRLEGPGDVPVVHNYRDVLAPVLTRHSGLTDFSRVFPNHPLQPLHRR